MHGVTIKFINAL